MLSEENEQIVKSKKSQAGDGAKVKKSYSLNERKSNQSTKNDRPKSNIKMIV